MKISFVTFCLGAILLKSFSAGILVGATVVLVKDFARIFFEKNKDFFTTTCNVGLIAFATGAIFFNLAAGILWGAYGILIKDIIKDDGNWPNLYRKQVLTEEESKLKYWNHLGEEGSIVKKTADNNGNVLVNFTSKTGHHCDPVAFSAILDQDYALRMVKGNS